MFEAPVMLSFLTRPDGVVTPDELGVEGVTSGVEGVTPGVEGVTLGVVEVLFEGISADMATVFEVLR